MNGLTPMQAKTLSFIKSRLEASRVAPSHDEISVHLGLKSKSGVGRLVSALEARGFVRRHVGRHRALEVVADLDERARGEVAGLELALKLLDDAPTIEHGRNLLRAEILKRRGAQ